MTISVGTPTASNSTSITIPSTTAGATLVVCVMSGNGSATPSVSGITIGGSASNFAQLKSAVEDFIGGYWGAIVWACPNCPGGQTAIVISGSNLELSSGDGGVVVYEAAGLALSSLLDKSNDDTGSSGSPTSGASGTTTQAAELVIGCAVSDGTITGPSSPWTDTQPAGDVSVAGYQVASSEASFTYTTTGGSGPWAAAVVTLLGATATPVSSSDTGSGAESSTIAAALSSSDTGSGADTATVGIAGAETGSGADTASPPPATLTGAETGSGADAAHSIAVTSADTGSGADTATAVLGASGFETGTGADTASITGAAVTSGETGSGADSSSIAAALPASAETGSGADSGAVDVSDTDAGSGADLATQQRYIPPPLVLWRAPDRLSKRGGTMK